MPYSFGGHKSTTELCAKRFQYKDCTLVTLQFMDHDQKEINNAADENSFQSHETPSQKQS